MAKMNHGKSTIATFIKAILYGINKNKNGNEYSEFERYKPWDDGVFSGSMEYTIENDRFLVTREFKNNNTKIFKEDGEDISSKFDKDRTRGIDIGFEQLGVDEDTFENSVYIGQDAIGVNETSQSSILQKLSNIIQSGDEDISYEKVSNKLNRKLSEEVGTDRATTKPKYILRKKIEELKSKEESLQKNKARHESIIVEIAELRKEEEKAKKEHDVIKGVLKIKSKYDDEVIAQKNKFDAVQNEKERNRKETDKRTKQTRILDTCIIVLAIIVLIAFLLINKYYIYSLIALIVGGIAIVLNSKLMYKETVDISSENFDLIQEDIRKKENKELSKLEKNSYTKKITDKRVSELKELLDDAEERIKNIDLNIHKLEIENKMLVGDLNELSSIHEELYEKEVEYEKVREEEEIINMALNALDKSYEELRERIIPELEKDVGYEISKTTNKEYNRIAFNSKDGLITYNKYGEPIKINLLSKGTIDEIYLGFRLAISDRYNNAPMIFDEAFVYFDDERLKNVLKILDEVCGNRQVIILSCTNREIKLLDELKVNYNRIIV